MTKKEMIRRLQVLEACIDEITVTEDYEKKTKRGLPHILELKDKRDAIVKHYDELKELEIMQRPASTDTPYRNPIRNINLLTGIMEYTHEWKDLIRSQSGIEKIHKILYEVLKAKEILKKGKEA